MKGLFRLLLLAAGIALGIWLWAIFFPSPQEVILKRVSALAATVSVSAKDGNFTRAGKAASLVEYFTTNAVITVNSPELPGRDLSGREEIREVALAGYSSVQTLSVRFLDATVRLNPDRQSADVECTAKAVSDDNKDFNVQECHFQFRKVDGIWLISRAETVKTLQ